MRERVRPLLLNNFEECGTKKSEIQIMLLKGEWIMLISKFLVFFLTKIEIIFQF